MRASERAMRDIEGACKKLGWERMGILEESDPCSGMVIGTGEYVKGIEGALVGAALHGIGGSMRATGQLAQEGDPEAVILAPESAPKHGVVPGEIDPLQEPAGEPTEPVQDRQKGAGNHGETPHGYPAGLAGVNEEG